MVGNPEDMERFQEEFAEWEGGDTPLAVVPLVRHVGVGSEGRCVVEAFDGRADRSARGDPWAPRRINSRRCSTRSRKIRHCRTRHRADMLAWSEAFERSIQGVEDLPFDDIDQIYHDLDENQSILRKMWEAAGPCRTFDRRTLLMEGTSSGSRKKPTTSSSNGRHYASRGKRR